MSNEVSQALWRVHVLADEGENGWGLDYTDEQALAIVLRDTHEMILELAKQLRKGRA